MTDFDRTWQALLQPGETRRLFDFDPPAPPTAEAGFDTGTAWWTAALCHASYLWTRTDSATPPPAGFRDEVLDAHGFTELEAIDEGAIQGMLVEHGDLAILAFRGTDDIDDWRTNLRIDAAPWPGGGRVHRGFLRAFDAIVATLLELRHQTPGHRWIVTGHSQGAAMAILASTVTRPVVTYAHGCPRMADRAFADSLENPVHQLINDRDIVTRLPPDIGGFEVCLPGEMRRVADGSIQPSGDVAGATPDQDGRAAFERLLKPSEWGYPVKELYDHAIVNYVAAIERAWDHAVNRPSG